MFRTLAQTSLWFLVLALASRARIQGQTPITTNIPLVTISATDPSATEGADSGVFTITREGDTNVALKVALSIGGTAQNGIDYVAISNSVVIPAGFRAVRI